MIRFIIKKRHKDCDSAPLETFITLDIDVPQLEQMLRRGGWNQYAYEHFDLEGVELIPEEKKVHG